MELDFLHLLPLSLSSFWSKRPGRKKWYRRERGKEMKEEVKWYITVVFIRWNCNPRKEKKMKLWRVDDDESFLSLFLSLPPFLSSSWFQFSSEEEESVCSILWFICPSLFLWSLSSSNLFLSSLISVSLVLLKLGAKKIRCVRKGERERKEKNVRDLKNQPLLFKWGIESSSEKME